MKSILVLILSVIVLSIMILIPNADAEDITLSGNVADGYYITDTNITTTQNNCTISSGSSVICIVGGTTELNPGFRVQTGALFTVMSGPPTNLPHNIDYDEDGLPDYWEFTYFGSIENQDASGDYDYDGTMNIMELTLGYDPSDSGSRPPSGLIYEYDELGRIKNNIQNP